MTNNKTKYGGKRRRSNGTRKYKKGGINPLLLKTTASVLNPEKLVKATQNPTAAINSVKSFVKSNLPIDKILNKLTDILKKYGISDDIINRIRQELKANL